MRDSVDPKSALRGLPDLPCACIPLARDAASRERAVPGDPRLGLDLTIQAEQYRLGLDLTIQAERNRLGLDLTIQAEQVRLGLDLTIQAERNRIY